MNESRQLANIVQKLHEGWKRGQRLRLEVLLESPDAQGLEEDSLLELILTEYQLRIDLGETPSPDEYIARFPALHDRIRRLLQMHQAMDAVQNERSFAAEQQTVVPQVNPGEDAIVIPDQADLDATFVPREDSSLKGDDKTPRPGERVRYFGDYELLSEIARGGMGVVYKARQANLNRVVALKMILSGQLASDDDIRRFYTEAEAAANLDHPGIVPVYEVGQHGGQHYFSMGFVDGQSLAGKLSEGPLAPAVAAELCRKVAEAIAYAHEKGVIHRDLKPANVLLDSRGEPKVTDFGLAKKMETDSGLTRTGSIMGTPSYMPPEQAAGKTDEVGPPSDVYSLGAILYCLLAGRPPFQAANPVDTLLQVIDREPVAPTELNALVPKDLETICLKCLQKEKHRRYASAKELAEDIVRWQRGEPIQARAVSWSERVFRWIKRNPLISGLGTSTVIALLAGTMVSTIFGLKSQESAQMAKSEEMKARYESLIAKRNRYAAHMNLVQSKWNNNDLSGVDDLLARQVPTDGQPDFRGFEWHYLQNQLDSSFLTLKGTTNIYHVAVSSSGSLIAGGGREQIHVWDFRSGKKLVDFSGHQDIRRKALTISSLHFISDDRVTSRAGWHSLNAEGSDEVQNEVCVWNVDGRIDDRLDSAVKGFGGHDAYIAYRSSVTSPDGGCIVTLEQSNVINCWDVKGHALRWSAMWPNADKNMIRLSDVAMSDDGKLIAVTDLEMVRIYQITDGTLLSEFRGGISSFSPEGKLLAVVRAANESDHSVIEIVSATDGVYKRTLRNYVKGMINSVCWSPDGKLIACADDAVICIWDATSGNRLALLKGHRGTVNQIAFSSDSMWLASCGGDGVVKTWDVRNADRPRQTQSDKCYLNAQKKARLRSIASNDMFFGFDATPDGKFVAFSLLPPVLQIWDAEKKELLCTVDHDALMGATNAMAFSLRGTHLAAFNQTGTIRVFEVPTGNLSREFRWNEWQGPNYVEAISFSNNGELLVAAGSAYRPDSDSSPGCLKIWNIKTGTVLLEWTLTRQSEEELYIPEIMDVAFHPNSRQVAFVDGTQRLTVVDIAEQKVVFSQLGHRRDNQYQWMQTCLCYDRTGERIVTASTDLKIWDSVTGEELFTLPSVGATDIAFDEHGDFLFAECGESIRTFDASRK